MLGFTFCGESFFSQIMLAVELGIERRQRAFDAEDRIGFDDRRFVHGLHGARLRGDDVGRVGDLRAARGSA